MLSENINSQSHIGVAPVSKGLKILTLMQRVTHYCVTEDLSILNLSLPNIVPRTDLYKMF